MIKLLKAFKAILRIIKNPWLLNRIINDDEVWMEMINRRYQIDSTLPVVDFADLLPNTTETLETFAFLGGGSLPTDLALLKGLSKKKKDCTYFEIGTWRGESVVNVADTGADCYTLNLPKETLEAMDQSRLYAKLHGFFSGERDNIHYVYGDSKTFDFSGLNKKFDLIFIDGDHHYDYIKNDTEKVFLHLLHDESIIVWHDYAYSPEKIRPEVMAGILDGTPKHFHKNLYHVSNTMCAIFTREPINSAPLVIPVEPNKKFKVALDLIKFNP